ncbi:MAG: hypothetical protein NZ899_06795 [Thermoguttaceae bacterium]|nr:hypothetical protein [Thermoguttaceae bacterium]MDW8078525.1 hypothetical protein [Thermoguttaceae bacterium]
MAEAVYRGHLQPIKALLPARLPHPAPTYCAANPRVSPRWWGVLTERLAAENPLSRVPPTYPLIGMFMEKIVFVSFAELPLVCSPPAHGHSADPNHFCNICREGSRIIPRRFGPLRPQASAILPHGGPNLLENVLADSSFRTIRKLRTTF